MGLGDQRLGDLERHGQHAVGQNRTGEDLDPVGAGAELPAETCDGFLSVGDFDAGQVVGFQKILDVDRSACPWVKGVAGGEDARPETSPVSTRRRIRLVLSRTLVISKTVVKPQRMNMSRSCAARSAAERRSAWRMEGVSK
jgi:hypothetical protein